MKIGNSTLFKFLQNAKAKSPMYFNSSGKITFSKAASEKTELAILTVPSFMIISFFPLSTKPTM